MSSNLYRAGPRKIREWTIDALDAGLVPMIEGPPGSGKSSIIKGIAEDAFLEMVDHRISTSVPEDFSGLPRFTDSGHAYYSPFGDIFPLESRPIPAGKNGFMLFLDEFNSGKEDVQAAAYKPLLDHMVGQHRLHPKCGIVAAGNRMEDRAIVNEAGTALQSRMVWLELEVVFQEWLEDVAHKYDYDYRIIAYLSKNKSKLMDFRPDHTDKTFCCPRTWEFMNRLIKGKTFAEIEKDVDGVKQSIYEMDGKTGLYAGTITSGVATEFVRFTKIGNALPSVEDICADPDNLEIPSDPNIMYLIISSLLGQVTESNYTALGTYANRFDMSMKILFFRSVIIRHPALNTHPVTVRAKVELARYLAG